MIKSLFNFTIVRLYIISQFISRILLSSFALWHNEIAVSDLWLIFTIGVVNDLVSLCYFLPIILLITIVLYKILSFHKYLRLTFSFIGYFSSVALLIFTLIAELVFWEEFSTRFNFIAVDYLIYTNEIIGTVKESLPYIKILLTIIIVSLLITFFSRKYIINQVARVNIMCHLSHAIVIFIFSLIAFNFYKINKIRFNSNKYAIELSKNGNYEFFSAFINNSLDYNNFYPIIDKKQALNIIRKNLSQDLQIFLNESNITHRVDAHPSTSNKYNIIFITVESLSGEFMEKFGNQQNITPNLDKLADESIFFSNLYAVGTRTVRGLEAITLSVPPIPGSAIIRRPNNHSLFNISTIFKNEGYDVNFIFGGYSYFDNLQNYFQGNGYRVLDRGNLQSNEISFSNIWGVADEDILIKSLELSDQSYKEGKPFFSLIMTTSNHRPYTFPEGRIDAPSGSGRNGAVKYTDYAIGKFLELAKTHPWFDNTIFIISADHCASSAGKTDLPVNKYHIPLLIYAPKILKPKIIDNLASQIDIAPTIFGLLNFSYNSKFFGQDILKTATNRAFISTYQLLGFMKDGYLVVLSPNEQPKTYKLVGNDKIEIENIPSLVEEAVSFYQIAYDMYITGEMKE